MNSERVRISCSTSGNRHVTLVTNWICWDKNCYLIHGIHSCHINYWKKTNYVKVYYDKYDIWLTKLIPCYFHYRNKESWRLSKVFHAICYIFLFCWSQMSCYHFKITLLPCDFYSRDKEYCQLLKIFHPIKEYLKFLNRLYDITWFRSVYA